MPASRRAEPLDLGARLLSAWRRNNEILVLLLEHVPPGGLAAVPAGSRGRTVAAQFFHLNRTRLAWLEYFETGRQPKPEKFDPAHPPTKAQLRSMLRASGRDVEKFLARAFAGEVKVRLFSGDPVRWFSYLVAHDSQHRGQILLALKQSGKRLPEAVSIQGLWGRWIYGA
jgi:uncharacterized damage-inducible protein DinB